jgi:hypothetical protein
MSATAVPATPSLYQKLAEITAEIGTVQARGFHDFLKTKYVTEEDLIDAVRGQLTSRNIVLLPSVTAIEERPAKTAKGKDTTITTVRLDWTFCDGETGQTHTCSWAGSGEDPSADGLKKAYTAALRYFLLKGFLVGSGDDASEAVPPPRSDGQQALSKDQYQGIVEAWEEAGRDHTLLHGLLDAKQIPTTIEGQELSLSQRVQLLSALQSIDVLKKLRDAKVKESVSV